MDDIENALTDRLRKTLGSTPLPPGVAGARAEAERRLHAAWLAETARQTAKVERAPQPAPWPAAPVSQAETPDPRMAILGQFWETKSSAPGPLSTGPAWTAPPVEDWTIAQRAGKATQEPDWVRPRAWSESTAPDLPAALQQAIVEQRSAPSQPQYASPQPQYARPQYAQPQYAPQSPQPFTPVAPQRAPSFPPSDDAVTLRGGPVENLEFARMRVEELRKLQEWRLGQERRISEEIGRRNALAEAALEDDLQARREAEEHRLEQWKAEARAQFERDLAREEAEFERRLADRRREAEVELEARLLRRLDDAARRAEALEKGRTTAPAADKPADPLLYVVRNTG